MSDLEIRLLGPFEVVGQGRPLRLGSAERALLALLVLPSRRTVTATTLMEQLWAEDNLPADPVNALHLRVSKLRRTLRSAGADVVVREGAGYRAEVDPALVDAERFTTVIRAARAVTATDEDGRRAAIARYDEALALWRGEPLAEFANQPWATVEAARLHQLRLAAVAERATLALASGRHGEVAADLEPLAAADPVQEALVGLLMTALYRGGRQADALEVFARTRTVLDEELGLEVSAPLRVLQQRILRQDPGLDGPPGTAPLPQQRVDGDGASGGPAGEPSPAGTPLVGRADELEAVGRLIRTARVVTLVGPGGAGKTALASAVGRAAAPTFRDGVVVVPFAATPAGGDVPAAAAAALGLQPGHLDDGPPTAQRVLAMLRHRHLLLVLDNCEHLVDAAARLAHDVVQQCVDVTVLATSREALAVPGEVQVAVQALACPPVGGPPSEVLHHAAAQLFVARARAVRADLRLDDETLEAIARLVRALDGMPLAIELAAARVSALTPAEIADRIVDRFRLLTGGPRTAEARQRTLRATVDWSHALLSEVERRVLRRLAVFQDGWVLEAAEAVVSGDDVPPEEVLDVLTRLVERSMVQAEPGRPTRFRLLETLRHYAADRLDEAGAEAATVAGRHADYFLRLAERSEAALRGRGQHETLALLRREQPDLEAALRWLSDSPDRLDDALALAGSLGWFWHLGRHLEGREAVRGLLPAPGASPRARARALLAAALVERPRACLVHPSERSAAAAREALELFLEQGDPQRAALARVLLAVEGVAAPDDPEPARLLAEADEQFTSDEDPWGNALVAFVRMETYAKGRHESRAVATGRAAAASFRALGDPWGLSTVLCHLGWALRQFGRYSESVPVMEEVIEVASAAGLHNTVQSAWGDLGITYVQLGDTERAAHCFTRAAAASEAAGDGTGRLLAAYGEGLLARAAGDRVTARARFTAAYDGFMALGATASASYALAGVARCDEHDRADDAGRTYAEVVRLATTAGEPGLVAFSLERLAVIAQVQDPAAAEHLRRRAQAVRDGQTGGRWPHEQGAPELAVGS